jgi:hypothetical protein
MKEIGLKTLHEKNDDGSDDDGDNADVDIDVNKLLETKQTDPIARPVIPRIIPPPAIPARRRAALRR